MFNIRYFTSEGGLNQGMMPEKVKKIFIKLFVYGFTLILIIALAVLGINLYIHDIAAERIVSKENTINADAIIVLGAYVFPDGRVSDMLADRLDVGYELYRKNKALKIIVSGDHGRINYDEVNNMRKYLLKKGVQREDIFMDHAGFCTYDSLYRARDVFKVKKAIIVTQSYHLKRAIYIAQQLGIESNGVASDIRIYPGMEYYKIREIAARVKAFLQASVLHPKPKYKSTEVRYQIENINVLHNM